jgi:hypothetical protein
MIIDGLIDRRFRTIGQGKSESPKNSIKRSLTGDLLTAIVE